MKSEAARALAAMRKTRIMECRQCRNQFKAVDKRATYCSDACRLKASRERHQKDYFDKPCEACGTVMFTNDRRIKYCSNKCRSAAAALRK